MSLRPEDIRSKAFPLRRQGYDREAVDAFLREVADDLRARAETAAAESVHLRVDGELKSLLLIAAERAERMQAEAEAEARRLRAEVEDELHHAREAGQRLLEEAEAAAVAAHAEAEQVIDRARREAEGHRAAAESEVQTLLAEARADAIHLVTSAQEHVEQLRVIERSVVDCLTRAGGFVAQAKSWLGATEETPRPGEDLMHLMEGPDGDPPLRVEATGDDAHSHPGSPDWAPPWWSAPDEERRSPVGNGKLSNGDGAGDR